MVGGGSVMRAPSVEEVWIGQVVRSWFINAWALSRAVDASMEGEGDEGSGVGSLQRRFPRSKV